MTSAGEIVTVLGPRAEIGDGLVDAHAHVWIAPPTGADPALTFALDDELRIAAELSDFAAGGGAAVVDCMPGGAGRDLGRLAAISERSGVAIVAATGFHLPQYYGGELAPRKLSTDDAARRYESELTEGVAIAEREAPIRAGIVKAAHPGDSADASFRRLFSGACSAARSTGAAMMVHTERGDDVEGLVELLAAEGVAPGRVILAHVDKRPDAGLHGELADAGFLLEYDTFLRPKYEPDRNVWPLVEAMLANGRHGSVACGLDLADPAMWRFGGAVDGPLGLMTVVGAGLERRGAAPDAIRAMLRDNVLARLAR